MEVSDRRPVRSRTVRSRRPQGEGSIYYDEGRNRWVGQVWLDGRRRKVSATTREGAARALGKLQHGDESLRSIDRRSRVGALLIEWQAIALPNSGNAPSTLESHAWAIALWRERVGSVRLVELDVVKVERALAIMAKAGLSRASLIKVRSSLRQALAWAERRRVIAYNPAANAELPVGAKGTRRRRALAAHDLASLLAQLEGHRWQAMFALMARVGLRPGEAAGVCVDAVDVACDPPTVSVIRAVHLERGRPVLGEALKTSGARRTLAIPADVAQLLRPLVGGDGLLFVAPDGGPVWPSTVRAELFDACAAAGITAVAPNELRHTAATIMADGGLPPHLIADVLGHQTTRMVDAVYRHRPPVIRGAESSTLPA